MKILRLVKWLRLHWHELTWAKVWNFIGAYRNKFESSSTDSFSDWKMEQFDWRHKLVAQKSPACITGGACVECGCDTPDKFFEPNACEGVCYPEWMTKEDWETFKNTDEWRTSQKTT